jgi:hypothetical protein
MYAKGPCGQVEGRGRGPKLVSSDFGNLKITRTRPTLVPDTTQLTWLKT